MTAVAQTSELCFAAEAGNDTHLKTLLSKAGIRKTSHVFDELGNSLLHWACVSNSPSTVRMLLSRGSAVNAVNAQGRTPLHWAAQAGSTGVISVLCSAKARVSQRCKQTGVTPLHLAAEFGHVHAVEKLRSLGSDINATDKKGQTPLHRAAFRGQIGTTGLLLSKGASAEVQDKINGDTPLHLAGRRGAGDVVAALLDHGCNPHTKNKAGAALADLHGQDDVADNVNKVADEAQGNDFALHWTIPLFHARQASFQSSLV